MKLAYRTDVERRLEVKTRRDELRDAEVCINGPKNGNVGARGVTHGPVVRGGKCQHCIDVHARTR